MYKNSDNTSSPLLSHCPSIGPDIKTCQAAGKKLLLSLGGSYPTTQSIKNDASAVEFAIFLWEAFGPIQDGYTGPRPFGDAIIDGFDFDIESVLVAGQNPEDLSRGYGVMVNSLRELYALEPHGGKKYYISASPQCVLPDHHLSPAIETAWFDFLFIQFYNTPQCSARAFLDHKYGAYGGPDTDISFDAWVSYVRASSKNRDVQLYLGLPAAPAVTYDTKMYLNADESEKLIKHFQCKYPDTFAGVMLYEATYSENNSENGKSFAKVLKDILLGCDCDHKPVRSSLSSLPGPTVPWGSASSGLHHHTRTHHSRGSVTTKRYSGPTGTSASQKPYSTGTGPVAHSKTPPYPYSSGTAPYPYSSRAAPHPYSTGTGSVAHSSKTPPYPYSSGTAQYPYASGTAPHSYSSGTAPNAYSSGSVRHSYSSPPGTAPYPYSSGTGTRSSLSTGPAGHSSSVLSSPSGTAPYPYSSSAGTRSSLSTSPAGFSSSVLSSPSGAVPYPYSSSAGTRSSLSTGPAGYSSILHSSGTPLFAPSSSSASTSASLYATSAPYPVYSSSSPNLPHPSSGLTNVTVSTPSVHISLESSTTANVPEYTSTELHESYTSATPAHGSSSVNQGATTAVGTYTTSGSAYTASGSAQHSPSPTPQDVVTTVMYDTKVTLHRPSSS